MIWDIAWSTIPVYSLVYTIYYVRLLCNCDSFRIEYRCLHSDGMRQSTGRWTKATATEMIDLSEIHGHIFTLHPAGGFVAYEYQNGPVPDLSTMTDAFFAELSWYLAKNDLSSLPRLQVSVEGLPEGMFELILDQGTIILDGTAVHGCSPYRQTGWTFELKDGEPRVCAADETHAKKVTGSHQVFNAGKPQPKLASVTDLEKALVIAGIIL